MPLLSGLVLALQPRKWSLLEMVLAAAEGVCAPLLDGIFCQH